MCTLREKAVLITALLVYFTTFQTSCLALQIRTYTSALPRANNLKCNEVLTKNLECPSIGAYPVAGVCDYFVRCIQTEHGVESEVDFCPDGQVYVINRCIKSEKDDCPQRRCTKVSTAVKNQHNLKTVTPSTAVLENVLMSHEPPIFTTPRNPLQNLHPSINGSMCNLSRTTVYPFLFLALFIIIINFL